MASAENQEQNLNPGEQGRASHITGSTTQGGSNFGQGSSHLGGETYQQGNVSNEGSNYENEADKLGSSTTGTNAEGASAPGAGGGVTNQPGETKGEKETRNDAAWTGGDRREDAADGEVADKDTKKLFEGDQRNTSLEQSSSMDEPEKKPGDRNASESRSWSAGTRPDINQ